MNALSRFLVNLFQIDIGLWLYYAILLFCKNLKHFFSTQDTHNEKKIQKIIEKLEYSKLTVKSKLIVRRYVRQYTEMQFPRQTSKIQHNCKMMNVEDLKYTFIAKMLLNVKVIM